MPRKRVETTRISVVIPVEHAEALQRLAERDRVSVSHVAAMAIERAVVDAEGGLLLGSRPASFEITAPQARTRRQRRAA